MLRTARHKLFQFLGAVALALCIGLSPAKAVIIVDPGPVGSTCVFSCVTFQYPNEILAGSLDIQLADMKHIQLFAGSSYVIGIFADTPPTTNLPVEIYFTDMNHDPIPGSTTTGTYLSTGTFSSNGPLSLAAEMLVHDIHITFLSAANELVGQNGEVFFFTVVGDDPVVGIWQPVSEPGTLAILGLGLAGLGYARRRKEA